jgi:hypothetical protein
MVSLDQVENTDELKVRHVLKRVLQLSPLPSHYFTYIHTTRDRQTDRHTSGANDDDSIVIPLPSIHTLKPRICMFRAPHRYPVSSRIPTFRNSLHFSPTCPYLQKLYIFLPLPPSLGIPLLPFQPIPSLCIILSFVVVVVVVVVAV